MLLCIMAIQNDNDRKTVEELYSEYGSTMLYVAKSILKDSYRAEDAVTQAFISIIENFEKISFENCKKTKALVVIIVRNVCYNMIKKGKNENIVSLEECEGISDKEENAPLDFAISEENYIFLNTCVSRLKESYQDILSLKLVYEYTDNEIAKILSITPNSVSVRYHRAKKALIKEIQKRGSIHE